MFQCNYIFIQTPTFNELRKRLEERGTESKDKVDLRIKNAEEELQLMEKSMIIDRVFTNDNKEMFLHECLNYILGDLYDIKTQ